MKSVFLDSAGVRPLLIALAFCLSLSASFAGEDKTLVENESEILYQFALSWYAGEIDAIDLIEFLTGGVSPFPTPTPTMAGETPTPTPTATMGTPGTFNFRDYFVLDQNSFWHYTGIEGTGTEDDFGWEVESQMQDIGEGKMATRLRVDTDDADDDFNGFVFYWYTDPSGQIFLNGLFLPRDEDFGFATVPSQSVVFTDPVLLGGDNMRIGDEVIDNGSGEVFVQSFLGDSFVTGLVTSTVRFTEFLPTLDTPLGTFSNVLRVEVDIFAEISGQEFEITDSTFFLKEGVGQIAQDQEPDPNDAQIQAIDDGQVGGVDIVAN